MGLPRQSSGQESGFYCSGAQGGRLLSVLYLQATMILLKTLVTSLRRPETGDFRRVQCLEQQAGKEKGEMLPTGRQCWKPATWKCQQAQLPGTPARGEGQMGNNCSTPANQTRKLCSPMPAELPKVPAGVLGRMLGSPCHLAGDASPIWEPKRKAGPM